MKVNGTAVISTKKGFVNPGDIFTTTNGELIEITGTTKDSFVQGDRSGGTPSSPIYGYSFRISIDSLPAPQEHGVKGRFYFLNSGKLAYARFL